MNDTTNQESLPTIDEILSTYRQAVQVEAMNWARTNFSIEQKRIKQRNDDLYTREATAQLQRLLEDANLKGWLHAYQNLNLKRMYGKDYQETLEIIEGLVNERIAELESQVKADGVQG